MTDIYNLLQDPQCTDSEIQELRRLHEDLDRSVLCGSHSSRRLEQEPFMAGLQRFNRYLDRALVVPTLRNDPELAFFHR